MKKFVLVSVSFRGKTMSSFFELDIVNGRAICPVEILDNMAASIGCGKGQTYTIG